MWAGLRKGGETMYTQEELKEYWEDVERMLEEMEADE